MATLYRKYRSQRFEEVIGQDPIITTLTNQIKLGRIGHAYLFTGSRGVGKTSCARIFARAVNCLHPVDGSPCGECEVCKKLAADNVDIVEMDAASNNGVDDARDIREKVKYLPVNCKYKVYIIDEVHMLTGGAFNALLKTIEEPPEHVIFILATTEPQKLPQTILSRCIRFDFKLVPTETLAKHIAHIYDREGIKYTEDAVEEIARLGEGSVRDALSVADTISSAADVITAEVVTALTGAGDGDSIAELFSFVALGDLKGTLTALDGFAANGKSMPAVCRQLIDFTRNVLVAKSVGRASAASGMINASKAALDKICDCADRFDMNIISRMLTELGAAENGLKYSVNPRVFLETSLVTLICGAKRDADILKRITALENNSVGSPAEQKKNNPIVEEYPVVSSPPEPAAAGSAEEKKTYVKDQASAPPQKSAEAVALPYLKEEGEPAARQISQSDPPPTKAVARSPIDDFDYIPPPPPDDYSPVDYPPPEPVAARADRSRAEFYAPPVAAKKRARALDIRAADEGEFRHLSADTPTGLVLLGKLAGELRRRNDAKSERLRQILARGVAVKEREECIGFVTPEETFLLLENDEAKTALSDALKSVGISKPARIERTADDLHEDDLAKARELFGKDGVE